MKVKYKYTLYHKQNPNGAEREALAVGELCEKPSYLHGCNEGYIFIRTKSNKIHMIEVNRIFEIDGQPFVSCCDNCAYCYIEYGFELCRKHEETEEKPSKQRCENYRFDLSVLY